MFTRRNMVGLLALSLLALGAPTTALAQGDRVTLKVSVVHAKKTGNKVARSGDSRHGRPTTL